MAKSTKQKVKNNEQNKNQVQNRQGQKKVRIMIIF